MRTPIHSNKGPYPLPVAHTLLVKPDGSSHQSMRKGVTASTAKTMFHTRKAQVETRSLGIIGSTSFCFVALATWGPA